VTLLPRSLFGRLVFLLIAVVALAVLTSIVLFRLERVNLLNRQLSETKLVQLQAIRAALASADGPQRRDTLDLLSREYEVRIIAESDRPMRGQPPGGPLMEDLAERLRERLGPETEIRFAPRAQMLFVRVVAAGAPYWIGVPVPPRVRALSRAAIARTDLCRRPGGARGNAAVAARVRTVGDCVGQPRLQRDDGEPAPDRAGSRHAAGGRLA